jgi:acetyl-CoA acyltransferase
MPDAVIVSAVRTAVAKGKSDGALARGGVTPIDISALVMKEAALRGGIDPRIIDDVMWGCAMPEASQGLNVARNAALKAAFPVDASAATINRFCSSGLQSVASAAQAVMSGFQDVVVAGGVEMMSQVPMSGYHTRLHPELTESYIGMGFTAERVAERYGVSREDQDRFAFESQQKAARAVESGVFAEQIVPVPLKHVTWEGAKKEVTEGVFDRDELPRKDTTFETLQKLRPAFKPANGPSPPATRARTPTAPPRWW